MVPRIGESHIGLHLKNIFSDGELDKTATTGFSSVVQIEGTRQVSREALDIKEKR